MITVSHLTKYYGDFMAVNDLSFEISEGHIYGFLGPNGAGKSTTMNIITGCLSATEGTVTIGGHDILQEPEAAKRLIGYLPEQPPLYTNETPLEYLSFVGDAKGLRGKEKRLQIAEVMEKTGLTHMQNRLISTLSKGYRQRVGIAQALLGNPKVIILDEPTVGLDPMQIIEIRSLVRSLAQEHTVIFSSHILSEVQEICDRVLIIAHGKLVAFDTPDNLETLLSKGNGIELTAEGTEEAVNAAIDAYCADTEAFYAAVAATISGPQMPAVTVIPETESGVATEPITATESVSTEGSASEAMPAPEAGAVEETVSNPESVAVPVIEVPAPEIHVIDDNTVSVRVFCPAEDLRAAGCRLFRAFATAGIPIFEMSTKKANLEQVFIELTESGGEPQTDAVGAVPDAGVIVDFAENTESEPELYANPEQDAVASAESEV